MLPGVHVVSLPTITQISGTGLFITLKKDEALRVEIFAFMEGSQIDPFSLEETASCSQISHSYPPFWIILE